MRGQTRTKTESGVAGAPTRSNKVRMRVPKRPTPKEGCQDGEGSWPHLEMGGQARGMGTLKRQRRIISAILNRLG